MSAARSWEALRQEAERRGLSEIPLNPASLPVKEIAMAIAERADELGLVWRLVPGTVAEPGTDGVMRVVLDGDTVAIDAVTMIGRLPRDARVFVILSPPAGAHIVGFLGYDFPAAVDGEAIGRPRLIKLGSDFNRTDANITAVTGMKFDALPNAVYEVRLRASMGGDITNADAKISWTVPSGAVMERYVLGVHTGETNQYAASVMLMGRRGAATQQTSGTFLNGAAGSSDFSGYWEDNLLLMGATGGTVQLNFGRVTAAGTAVGSLHSNTYFTVQRFRPASV